MALEAEAARGGWAAVEKMGASGAHAAASAHASSDECARLLRRETLLAVSTALQALVGRVLLNGGATSVEAERSLSRALTAWRESPPDIRPQIESLAATWSSSSWWHDARYSPLLCLGAAGMGDGGTAVADDLPSKLAALHASVDVLEQVLLSDVFIVNRRGA